MFRSRFATGVIRTASTDSTPKRIGRHRSFVLLLLLVLSTGWWSAPAEARRHHEAVAEIGVIRAADLPSEGREVLAAIRAGGPFVSPRDGITFGNREGFLPQQRRGYYAEYTVPTPGAQTRGARRIIAGRGTTGDVRTSNEYYFTNDHYQSFRRIVQ